MAYDIVIRDRACLQCGTRPIGGTKYCSKQCLELSLKFHSVPHSHTCENCGEGFIRLRPTGKYCSVQCRSGQKKKTCSNCFETFYTKVDAKEHCKACSKQKQKNKVYRRYVPQTKKCLVCDKEFREKRQHAPNKACSRKCGVIVRKWMHERQTAYVKAKKELFAWGKRARQSAVQEKSWQERYEEKMNARKAQMANRNCKICGNFVGYAGNGKPRKYCSKKCVNKIKKLVGRTEKDRLRSKIAKSRREAKKRGVKAESVNPIKVFDRDGWRCHICKRKTPKELRGTYKPNAPELDHIVPLSLGGDHTYLNTACCCRSCNGKKGATLFGQPSLLALCA